MSKAELSVVGSVILDPSCLDVVETECTPADFADTRARVVYEAAIHLRDCNLAIDYQTLGNYLQEHDLLEKIGGAIALSKITDYVVTSANVQTYARQVSEAALVRRVRAAAATVMDGDTADPYKYAAHAVEALTQACDTSAFLDDSEPAYAAAQRALREYESGEGSQPLLTGFAGEVHELSLHPELTILAAHAGVGKSTFALNILANVSISQRKPALYISLEDSKDVISARLMSLLSGVRLRSIRDRTCSQNELERLRTAVSTLARGSLRVVHKPGLDVDRIALTIRREIYRHAVEFVVIDYFSRIRGGKTGDEFNQMAAKAREIADIAQSFHVPILLLHHLNKSKNARRGRPTYHDLRYAGGDEARAVWILHRDQKNASGYGSDFEIIVSKNNNGPTGTIYASYDLHRCWIGQGEKEQY